MKKRFLFLLVLLTTYTGAQADTIDPELFFVEQATITSSILFPKNITQLPEIPIFCAGNEAHYEIDHTNKKITFNVLVSKKSASCYLLICDQVVAHMHEDTSFKNLVQYLKVSPGAHYRLYRISLIPPMLLQKSVDAQRLNKREWKIEEMILGPEGALPDQTIIVSYNAHWVSGLETTSTTELPHIVIRPDLIEYLGGEEALRRSLDQLCFTTLDMRLIHAKIKPDFKKHEKTIVAMITR